MHRTESVAKSWWTGWWTEWFDHSKRVDKDKLLQSTASSNNSNNCSNAGKLDTVGDFQLSDESATSSVSVSSFDGLLSRRQAALNVCSQTLNNVDLDEENSVKSLTSDDNSKYRSIKVSFLGFMLEMLPFISSGILVSILSISDCCFGLKTSSLTMIAFYVAAQLLFCAYMSFMRCQVTDVDFDILLTRYGFILYIYRVANSTLVFLAVYFAKINTTHSDPDVYPLKVVMVITLLLDVASSVFFICVYDLHYLRRADVFKGVLDKLLGEDCLLEYGSVLMVLFAVLSYYCKVMLCVLVLLLSFGIKIQKMTFILFIVTLVVGALRIGNIAGCMSF